MIFHVKHVVTVPEGATVHFTEPYSNHQSFSHANFCGTYGTDQYHSSETRHVTCKRCLVKLQTRAVALERARV